MLRVTASVVVILVFLAVVATIFTRNSKGPLGAVRRVALCFIAVSVFFPIRWAVSSPSGVPALVWALSGMFAVMGLGVLLWEVRKERRTADLRKKGIPGLATIESVTDTGWREFGIPVLKLGLVVQVPGRVPYLVSHRRPIHNLLIPRIMGGQALPVLVDPADPQRVLLDLGDDPPSATRSPQSAWQAGAMAKAPFIPSSEKTTITVTTWDPNLGAREVLDQMVQGTATIVAIDPLELPIHTSGGDRLQSLELDVRLSDGRPPYRAHVADRVPEPVPESPQPGMTVDVEVDPSDPARVSIVWDMSSSGTPSVGIEARTLPPERADQLGVSGGVEVGRVQPGGAAAASGLRPGDIIVRVDGNVVTTMNGFAELIRRRSPWQTVALTMWRDGREMPDSLVLRN